MRFSPKSPIIGIATTLVACAACCVLEEALRRRAHKKQVRTLETILENVRALQHPSVQAMVDNIRAAQMTSHD
jgi:hypothetical protein